MLAPFVVGADTNLNGANAGPTPGLAPTPPSVTLVWQRHSQTDRAVNKSMRQMLSDEHHHLHRRRRLGSLGLAFRHHGGSNLPPRQRRGPSRNAPLESWCRCGHTEARSNQLEWAYGMTYHIEPRAAQERPVRSRG